MTRRHSKFSYELTSQEKNLEACGDAWEDLVNRDTKILLVCRILTPPDHKVISGTPVALRGIREVTDKNKHIVLEAIFNADFIPDHLLPVGIHRCGQQRWRAHLCTVGLKFSGPPRDNVREACEDRRKFCEENGVNFVLYGKQTHAKGPIGSRSITPSTFPRLSDFVSSMSRASASGSGGNSQMILAGLKTNPAMRPFFDSIDNAKKVIQSRKAESEGIASFVVTKSHAALHKRIMEDSLDRSEHVYLKLKKKRMNPDDLDMPFFLCPVTMQYGNLSIRFLWSIRNDVSDHTLSTYLESILCNAQPPMSEWERSTLIQKLIESDISAQVQLFSKLNDKIRELIAQHNSMLDAIKVIHATPAVHTRKSNITTGAPGCTDPTDPMVTVFMTKGETIRWNALTPDAVAEEYAKDWENDDPEQSVIASDILFNIIDHSFRHRCSLFHVQPHAAKKASKAPPVHDGLDLDEQDINVMEQCENSSNDYYIAYFASRFSRRAGIQS